MFLSALNRAARGRLKIRVKLDHKAICYIGELIINPKFLAWKITLELLTGSGLAKMRLNTLLARDRAVDGQTGLPRKR